jgi:hypothetical protein
VAPSICHSPGPNGRGEAAAPRRRIDQAPGAGSHRYSSSVSGPSPFLGAAAPPPGGSPARPARPGVPGRSRGHGRAGRAARRGGRSDGLPCRLPYGRGARPRQESRGCGDARWRAPHRRVLAVRAWSVRSSDDADDLADRRAPVGHGRLLGGATRKRSRPSNHGTAPTATPTRTTPSRPVNPPPRGAGRHGGVPPVLLDQVAEQPAQAGLAAIGPWGRQGAPGFLAAASIWASSRSGASRPTVRHSAMAPGRSVVTLVHRMVVTESRRRRQSMERVHPKGIGQLRRLALAAGRRRVHGCRPRGSGGAHPGSS